MEGGEELRKEKAQSSVTQTSEIQPEINTEVNKKYAGRLKNYFIQWRNLFNNCYVLKLINGYKIEFLRRPRQNYRPKMNLSLQERIQIGQCLKKLIDIGAISKSKYRNCGFYSTYFLTPKKDGSLRFILNLQKLNEFIKVYHFKMDSYKTVLNLMYRNCYFVTIDLKDAYYLLPIHPNDRKYLMFEFEKQSYTFNCLPFGLATAPRVFTKLMKPILSFLRNQNILIVAYLDDLIIIGQTADMCLKSLEIVKNTLIELGFLINWEKSNMSPSTVCQYLGFIFDSTNMTLSLPTNKRQVLLGETIKMSNRSVCKIRDFAKFLGKLIAACPALDYSWTYTKRFEAIKSFSLKLAHKNYNALMNIPTTLHKDFLWWIKNLMTGFRKIWEEDFTLEIFSDASLTGWGGMCGNETVRGFWSENDRLQNIHYLELKAAYYALKTFGKGFKNCRFLLRMDNTTGISFINRMGGTRQNLLNEITRTIWKWCEHRRIIIFASYINTKDNYVADTESRALSIETEYQLANNYFEIIVEKFGKPTIDLFASKVNSKCSRYISWHKDPDSIAVDAFTVSWREEFFYAFPPFSIISKVLNKVRHDKARGILVVPLWKSQPWFPVFNELLTTKPLIFDPNEFMVLSPFRTSHPLWKDLSLVVGSISGNRS